MAKPKKRKKVMRIAKLQFKAGQAKPGPELAGLGINMPQFCVAFNEQTKSRPGDIVPVVITAYEDKTFDFILKTTPASVLLAKAANIDKGSSNAKVTKVGKVTNSQVQKIAEYKMPDLNARNINAAMKIIKGTAKNMGIEVED